MKEMKIEIVLTQHELRPLGQSKTIIKEMLDFCRECQKECRCDCTLSINLQI